MIPLGPCGTVSPIWALGAGDKFECKYAEWPNFLSRTSACQTPYHASRLQCDKIIVLGFSPVWNKAHDIVASFLYWYLRVIPPSTPPVKIPANVLLNSSSASLVCESLKLYSTFLAFCSTSKLCRVAKKPFERSKLRSDSFALPIYYLKHSYDLLKNMKPQIAQFNPMVRARFPTGWRLRRTAMLKPKAVPVAAIINGSSKH